MVTKLSESISKFVSILNDAKTRLPALKEELETVEKQQQDILHAIENSEYDDGRKLCSMLKKVRKHRRQIKDDIAIYEPICELASTLATKGAISIIEQSMGLSESKNAIWKIDSTQTEPISSTVAENER